MAENKTKFDFLKKLIISAAAAVFAILLMFAVKAYGAEVDFTFSSTDGSNGSSILDDNNSTMEPFEAGTVLTLTSQSQIGYVYVKWDKPPGSWTLKAGDTDISCGQKGFIQEVVALDKPAAAVSIVIPAGGAKIVDIYAYAPGELPAYVHVWKEPWEKADILLLSTHSDDDTLFFGGLIPNYTNCDDVAVQLVYCTEHWSTGEDLRMQELLDGLWTMGVDHYPQMGEFVDNPDSIENAEAVFDYEEAKEYCVAALRKFKPQVVIGQDIVNGEYGHGAHIFFAKALADAALHAANDSTQYPDSASKYGTWEVKKLYFHVYPEKQVELDARKPLSKFGGKTALEVAKEAYLCHDSQQWTWFYVDDGYDEAGNPNGCEFACTVFGLYYSKVGDDAQMNDVLENITPYSASMPEEPSDGQETTTGTPEDDTVQPAKDTGNQEKSEKNTLLIIIIIIVIIIALIIVIAVVQKNRRRKAMEAKRRRRQARQRHEYDDGYRQERSRNGNRPERFPDSGRDSGNGARPDRFSDTGKENGRQPDNRRDGRLDRYR